MNERCYGFFPGGDPRSFEPDYDLCTDIEIAAWKEACDQWNNGVTIVCKGSHEWLVDSKGNVLGTYTFSRFGIGIYTYDDEEFEPQAPDTTESTQAVKVEMEDGHES